MKTKTRIQKVHFMRVKRKYIKMNIIPLDLNRIALHQPYNKITFLVFLRGKIEKMIETTHPVVEK